MVPAARLVRPAPLLDHRLAVHVEPRVGAVVRLEADPLRLNANLGYYTNFMNLFDLSGVAVPAGFRADGLPFGITLVGPRGADRDLLHIAGQVQRASVATMGALHVPLPVRRPPDLVSSLSTVSVRFP